MSSRRKRATRADVARLAGTSVAVVSYVVNNGPRPVSAATRERVLAAIAEVGYEPDTVARALASGVSGLYGLVVPSISNPFFSALAHELEDAVSASGRVLLLGDSANRKSRQDDVVRMLARRRADGVFFIGVDDDPDLRPFAGLPVVLMDRVAADDDTHSSVVIDNEAAAYDATRHLVGHGYRRIGVVRGPAELGVGQARYRGWRRAVDEAGLAVRADWVVEAPFSPRGGYDAGRALVASADRPQAVFTANEQQTLGLLAAVARAGLSVPDDLAVMSFDGTEASDYAVPRVSSVVQDLPGIAAAAVAILERQLGSGTPVPPQHVVAGHALRIGRSCGCPDRAPRRREGEERP